MIKLAERILVEHLAMAHEEKYLYFTDVTSQWDRCPEQLRERRRVLHGLYEAFSHLADAYPRGDGDKYESTTLHGVAPRENIWRLAFGNEIYDDLVSSDLLWKLMHESDLDGDAWRYIHRLIERNRAHLVDCVIAFPWFSTTHTRFRKLLTDAGCRYVSMPVLTEKIIRGPLSANWPEVRERTQRVVERLAACSRLRITCPAGTDLELSPPDPSRILADSGYFDEPGSYGNLPAGEAYFVPRAGSAAGRAVLRHSSLVSSTDPTTIIVQAGRVERLEGETELATALAREFLEDHGMRNIAEFGVGTNPLARDPLNMLESEKILGTVHIALGDDSSIGGTVAARQHLDHVILDPSVLLYDDEDRESFLIEGGRLLI